MYATSFAEYSRKMKEEQDWREKTPVGKLKSFLGRKFALFKVSFLNSVKSFKHVGSRLLGKKSTMGKMEQKG